MKTKHKLTEKELIKRDVKRDIWQEVLDGIEEIKTGHYGRKVTLRPSPSTQKKRG